MPSADPFQNAGGSSSPLGTGDGVKEERKSRATIKDVAKAAGVHFTTVSLALRKHSSIPLATQNYIRAAADRLGYAPNPVFSALTHFHLNGRVRAEAPKIAYILNHSLQSGAFLYRHQHAFLEGAQTQARLLGYEIDVLSLGKDTHNSESLARHLDTRQIKGIVIAAFEYGLAELSLEWENYATVKINSLHMDPRAPMVANDQRQDVRIAFQRMLALGYQRIGLAVGRADEDGTDYRYTTGYLTEQFVIPDEDRVPALLFPYKATAAQVSDLFSTWVREYRIQAVLCNWSNVEELLQNAGLRVPEQVACACLCLVEKNPRVAGVCPNLHMVGAKAISLLTTLLKAGERGIPEYASRTYVRSFWQDGETAPGKS